VRNLEVIDPGSGDHSGDFNMHKGFLIAPMPVRDVEQQVIVVNGEDHSWEMAIIFLCTSRPT
jgi:hypothetical protein